MSKTHGQKDTRGLAHQIELMYTTSTVCMGFFSLSLCAEAALHSLLGALTNETYDDPTQHLEREQALAKQFAEILHFTLRFDELKVTLPSLPSFLLNTSAPQHADVARWIYCRAPF